MPVTNTIIFGVDKSGSTFAFQYLKDHPNVCFSRKKETTFFLPATKDNCAPLSADTYVQYWFHREKEQCVFEATPEYFYDGMPLISEIKRICRAPTVALILREPLSRTMSYFKLMKSMLAVLRDMAVVEYVKRCHAEPDFILDQQEPFADVSRNKYEKFWNFGFLSLGRI